MDLYDFDEREKEQEGMEFVIDGLKIEIPEVLIQERMELLFFDTKEDTISDIENSLQGYLNCLTETELANPSLNENLVAWLSSEMDIYKPNNEFKFDACSGFDLKESKQMSTTHHLKVMGL